MKVANMWGKLFVVGLVALGAFVILLYFYNVAGGRLPTAGDRYEFSATVAEPQQLLKNADVRAAGVRVGEVTDIRGRGSSARVTMALEQDVVPIYTDATVLVRQKTLVGENYIELERGTPRAGVLPDGAELSREASSEAVPIDRVLNSLDAETRRDISQNLRSLGTSFDGHGAATNEMLAALQPLVTDGSQVTDILNAQRRQVADVLEHGNTVFRALASRRQDLTTLLRTARTTAAAVAERDEQLRGAFAEFPSTLRQARSSVGKLSAFSGRAVPVVRDVRLALTDLDPVMRDLRPTATAGIRLFDELPKFTEQADPLLDKLRSFAKVAGPTLPALEAVLRQANPALEYLEPYDKDLSSVLSTFGALSYADKYGIQGECRCPFGDRSFANWTPAMKQAADVLLQQGIIQKIQRTDNNHFRPAGSVGVRTGDFDGSKYPRVEGGR